MIDFTTPFGKTIQERLHQEQVIWLTTVDAHSTPQPRPVWFHWDGQTLLIFSQVFAAKVRQIAANPHVALNFNTDAVGEQVGVLIGEAAILTKPVSSERLDDYLEKYRQGIVDIGMNPESFQAEYSVSILVTPLKVRGF